MPKVNQADKSILQVVQITDCHLKREPDGKLLGMKTRDSFEAVMQLAEQNHLASADFVIASGDLAQDGSVEAYQHFKQRTSGLAQPVAWFPGNHDDRDNMLKVANGGSELSKVHLMDAWQFVMLDSLVPGAVHGRLKDSELLTLEKALSDHPEKHTLVCLHHHVVPIDCQWLDGSNLKNSVDLMDILSRHENVKAVLCGHIHQELDQIVNDIRFIASPSTCIQFKPKSDDFALDELAPGYRWLHLHSDGHIETEVVRANDFEYEVDMTSDGY